MTIKKISTSGIRRWEYREPEIDGGGKIEIESSIAGDGDVLLRMKDGLAIWIKKAEVEAFIDVVRQASQQKCSECDGKGYR